MFITLVSEFAAFLVKDEHSIEELLAHIVETTLQPLQATSAFISELNNENQVKYVSQYGFKQSTIDPYSTLHNLQDRYPITDAINERSTVWINTLPTWPDEYELLKALPYENGEKSFICFPIEKRGTPVSVFGIFCEPVIQPDAEIDTFLNQQDIVKLFAPIELDHIKRYSTYLREVKVPHEETQITHLQTEYSGTLQNIDRAALGRDFKSFFSQYDQRRNQNFVKTFPRLSNWYTSL